MRLLKNCVEAVVRATASLCVIIIVSMTYNCIKFKCKALLPYIVILLIFTFAFSYTVSRRKEATNEEELNTMFTLAKKLSKYGLTIYIFSYVVMATVITLNMNCTTSMLEKYEGIDQQFSEEYSMSEGAIAVIRSIPGTFAARAYYVVSTPMSTFDFKLYNNMLAKDCLIFTLILLHAITRTTTESILRYNRSLKRIKNADN